MKCSRAFLFALLLAVVIPAAIAVQASKTQPRDRQQADKAAAAAVVRAALDAIRDADGKKFASLELDGYRIVSLQGPPSRRRIFQQTAKAAAAGAQARKPDAWEVRPLSLKVLLDPNGMAVVWVPYVFYLNGAAHHCGIESWTLFRVSGNWRIINFADSDNELHGRDPETVCP